MTDMIDTLTDVVDNYIGDISTSRDIVIDILKAMREPTEEMDCAVLELGCDPSLDDVWEAIIDAALGEHK